jgi:hypothetical protein
LGFRRRSPAIVFFAVGDNGLRYRNLFFRPLPNGQFHIGTRHDIGARHPTNCLSHKQRRENEVLKMLRLIRRKRWEKKQAAGGCAIAA